MYFTITFFSAVDNLRIVESACRKSLFSPLNKFSDLHKSSENLGFQWRRTPFLGFPRTPFLTVAEDLSLYRQSLPGGRPPGRQDLRIYDMNEHTFFEWKRSERVSLWLKPLQIFDVDIAAIEMEQAEDDAPSPVHRPPLCIALNDTFYVVLVRGRHSAPGFQFCNSRLP